VTSLAVFVLLMAKSPCNIWSQALVKVTRPSVVVNTAVQHGQTVHIRKIISRFCLRIMEIWKFT
jgi:hypothetical protein